MENNGGNNAMNASTNLRQQQQIRDPLVAQKLQDQQQQTTTNNSSSNNGNENQQQFCLRWHNHQTSLLSTLPVLLDQSHLTDVTISAEGRTLRAHRVVLSACSSFFLEIFRTLETTHHPVIIIPGASFAAIVALLTFMYSGEVNVYEEQIPMLLSLAETLGIKGLADVHNNLQKFIKISQDKDATMASANKEDIEEKLSTPPSPQQSAQSACGNFSLPQTPLTSNLNNSLAAAASTFNPLLSSSLSPKLPLPLENLFLKSLQFYPNLMHQPLNFSQAALNKTSELLSKYQQQCNLYQANLGMNPKDLLPVLMHNTEDDSQLAKRFCSGLTEKKTTLNSQQQHLQQQQHQLNIQQQQQKDIKRLDKIVENLRGGVSGANTTQASANTGAANKLEKVTDNAATTSYSSPLHAQLSPLSIKTSLDNYTTNSAALMQAKSSMFSSPTATETTTPLHTHLPYNISAEDQLKLQQHLDKYAQSCARTMEAAAVAAAANENLKNDAARTAAATATTPPSPQTKTPSNSKLYATCFICHKQLSNQYNLRVHLETHQNVRYACNVCSHVSRSKDALRKHVSYRHPGAPSPCETEARRKRANKLLATQLTVANLAQSSPSSGEITPTSPNTLQHFQNAAATATNTPVNDLNCTENTHAALTAAQLTSAYQMFMPNQFHLAAVAANAAQQQQPQQQSSSSAVKSKDFITTHMDNEENCTANSEANSKANLNPTTTLATTTTPTSTFTTVNVTNSTTLTTSTELQTTTNNNSIINSGENRISPTPLNS